MEGKDSFEKLIWFLLPLVVGGLAALVLNLVEANIVWRFVGVALSTLLLATVGCARHYFNILAGADDRMGEGFASYVALRARLIAGGTPDLVYRRWLKLALDLTDVFFGDRGRNDRSWLARTFRLQTPGARWTAPAFDRCLTLALVYPILSILMVWVGSGQVDVAEKALGLPRDATGGARAVSAIFIFLAAFSYIRVKITKSWRSLLWFVSGVGAGLAATIVAGTIDGTVGVDGAVSVAGFAFVAGTIGIGGAGTVGSFVVVAVAANFYSAVVVAVGIVFIADRSKAKKWQGRFLILSSILLTLAVIVAPYFLASLPNWGRIGALLLFFGLLTLVNAPFDWLAIGLTRALLRRGLAPGGWGPFVYAALDAVLGTLLVIALAFVTVFAVQTYNDVTALRAGDAKIIYPLGILFQGLQDHPADPQYWWVWLTLFSTQIPAALNLCIASASLFRGWPWVTQKIIARLPAGQPVPEKPRIWLALALAAQITFGGLAAVVLLCGLVYWLIPLGMPWLGEHILAYTRDAWVPNYPARLIVWLLSGGRDMGVPV